jgi:hypothetical protein
VQYGGVRRLYGPFGVAVLALVPFTVGACRRVRSTTRALSAVVADSGAAARTGGGDGGSPKLTMNRTQAGTPDADGWYPAHSEGGRFGVRMPAPFNDFRVDDVNEKGAPIVLDVIGTQRTDGVKFSVSCMRGGDRTPDQALRAFEANLSGAKVTPLTVDGLSAVDVRSTDPAGVTRAVELPDAFCLLIVDPQGPTKTVPEADAEKMFESFAPDPAPK